MYRVRRHYGPATRGVTREPAPTPLSPAYLAPNFYGRTERSSVLRGAVKQHAQLLTVNTPQDVTACHRMAPVVTSFWMAYPNSECEHIPTQLRHSPCFATRMIVEKPGQTLANRGPRGAPALGRRPTVRRLRILLRSRHRGPAPHPGRGCPAERGKRNGGDRHVDPSEYVATDRSTTPSKPLSVRSSGPLRR